jgi:hypothetical protein
VEVAEVVEQREGEDRDGLLEGCRHVGRDRANDVGQLSERHPAEDGLSELWT